MLQENDAVVLEPEDSVRDSLCCRKGKIRFQMNRKPGLAYFLVMSMVYLN
jgi:hypothetical protein